MEEQKIERELMGLDEFKEHVSGIKHDLHLIYYNAVNKFKSVRRAIRRQHVTTEGYVIPKRLFHNKANTCRRKGRHSRDMNDFKRNIYAGIKYQREKTL